MIVTLGMWIHVLLNATVCFERTQTRNPIWGELRLVGVIISTTALWVVVATLAVA